MRAIIQRTEGVKISAEVDGDYQVNGEMGEGLLVLLGVEESDSAEDVDYLFRKIKDMRIFNDDAGKMNLSVMDVNGSIAIVSQFTLHAKTKKGNRPSFIDAAKPETAIPLYEYFVSELKKVMQKVETGKFGADMQVSLVNDGPVTLLLDTENKE